MLAPAARAALARAGRAARVPPRRPLSLQLGRLDHVCVAVSDVDRSIAWYERVLGLTHDFAVKRAASRNPPAAAAAAAAAAAGPTDGRRRLSAAPPPPLCQTVPRPVPSRQDDEMFGKDPAFMRGSGVAGAPDICVALLPLAPHQRCARTRAPRNA